MDSTLMMEISLFIQTFIMFAFGIGLVVLIKDLFINRDDT